ncbi:transcription factor IIA, alpha/beta subunit [Crucibulum laeve]|uniref:Transcription factor IIA, alpha/beta subunit n=1 Tax=Crucibulum laeve TaxID=68775 RepID=A0A5C3MIV3_9AGAR|nr:transcription factor IIA, alpha/beta subunit [Crucibulum laeve]
MSNKIVPTIYRAVIDDVIQNIKSEFDEYGVAEDVLAELQHKWENKVIASHVAEFETPPPPPPPPPSHQQPHHHGYPPPHAMHMHYAATAHNPYASLAVPGQPQVKAEPMDTRYMLAPGMQYALPPLPGPTINGSRTLPPPVPPHPGGQTGVISFARPAQGQAPAAPTARAYAPPAQSTSAQPTQQPAAQQQSRIPQTDGPASDSSGDEDSPSPPPSQSFAPRTSHPSLPQPISATPSSQTTQPVDSEAINSDLDDSDTGDEEEAEEGSSGDTDIVFCTYDKVARVKNKWKCILKDGMIHINGKDYLFAKCTGEFEW